MAGFEGKNGVIISRFAREEALRDAVACREFCAGKDYPRMKTEKSGQTFFLVKNGGFPLFFALIFVPLSLIIIIGDFGQTKHFNNYQILQNGFT